MSSLPARAEGSVAAHAPALFAMAMLTAAVTATVGTARAQEVTVSSNGTPTVSFPLSLPPGIAGVAPSLALSYDGGANGPVGFGWNLGGTSAITRCHGIIAVDGVIRRVTNGSEDKLCLDGERLVQVDPSSGEPLAAQVADSLGLASGFREFRTEKDTYARIRAYGAAAGNVANGPAYFKVWTKAGQVVEYGNTVDSAVVPIGHTAVGTWFINRTGDIRGNYVTYTYEQRQLPWGSVTSAGDPLQGKEITLQEIRYTGTTSQAPSNKVVFVYEERPATAPAGLAHDRLETFTLGSKHVSVKRLTKVQTFVNAAAANPVKVKTYRLVYNQGPITNRSRVEQVVECAGPSEQPCLPPHRFEYASGHDQAYQANAAFRASPLGNLVMHSTPPPLSYAPGTTPPVKYGVIPADFNGDGRTDILRWSENASQNQLYFSNGDGSFSIAAAFNITSHILYRHDGCFSARVADFDGDGLSDILRQREQVGFYNGLGSTTCPGTTDIFFNKGDGSFTRKEVTGVVLSNSTSFLTHGNPAPGEPGGDLIGWTPGSTYYLLDVNGDGRMDVVDARLPQQGNRAVEPADPCTKPKVGGAPGEMEPAVCTRVFLGDGQGNFSEIATNVTYKTLYSPPEGAYALGQPSRLVDIDGDGLLDVTGAGGWGQTVENSPGRAWRNLGDGRFEEVGFGDLSSGLTLDFNGDGRAELLRGELQATTRLYLATGQTLRGVNHNITLPLKEMTTGNPAQVKAHITSADFDRDGRADVLRWHEDPTQNVLLLSNGDGTFRESASFNLKAAANVLQNGAGTNGFVTGDFTGRGQVEILRVAASPAGTGSQTNELYLPTGNATPPDVLVAMVSSQGIRTDVTWVPLGLPSSGALGPRYIGDRTLTAIETYPRYDAIAPTHVVASTVTDTGVGNQRLTTEYQYRGLKASNDGRGLLGFREMRQQQPAADGTDLTQVVRHLQQHPYIGAVASEEVWRGALNASNPTVLSNTTNIHCDQTAAAGAPVVATVAAPCPSAAKIRRPYVYQNRQEAKDLAGLVLPVTTTTISVNDSGDPTEVLVSTSGTAAGIAQTFTQRTTNTYHPRLTSGDHWILGRVQQVRVERAVPNSLPSVSTSAGTAPLASATAGTGPLQAGALTSVAFGNVAVGSSATLTATLRSTGIAPLTITVPGAGSVSGTDFAFVSTNCTATLAVNSTCTVSVRFSPSAAQSRSGTLAIATGAGNVSAALGGTGTGGTSTATLVGASTLALGSVTVGAAAPTQGWTFRNDGTGPLSLTLATLNAPFALVSNACTGVAPAGTCAITVRMNTGTAGTFAQSGIAVSGAGQGNRSDLGLSGTVVAPTTVSGSPTPLNFATVRKEAVAQRTLTITNSGSVAANGITWIAPPGSPQGDYFIRVSGSTCPASGGSLAAGANCTMLIQYTAACTSGAYNPDLVIQGSNFPSFTIRLEATTGSGSC